MERVVVVGGGLAGVRAVEALRKKGYEGALTLVSAERHRPYDRPPLSKAVLAGDSDDTTVDADWDALRCDLLLGERATALRPDGPGRGGVVATTAGDLPFDGLVIATGATPITLPGDGRQHVVRTIEDARELRGLLTEGARVAIVGAGWIGAEVATTAAKKGCAVTVVEAADTPLANALGPEAGALTAPWYAEAGVELRTGVKVAEVDDRGLVLAADGAAGRIDADAVVVGVGVVSASAGSPGPACCWSAASSPTPASAPATRAPSPARPASRAPTSSPSGTAPPGGRSGTGGGCWSSTGTPPSTPPRSPPRPSSARRPGTTRPRTSGPSSSAGWSSTPGTTRRPSG
ncbi:FAD/NAD(P)-binding oxidoreductase [Actinomadura sp. CNU-125]|uniref:NAD(P)/FAD-dependent oxidoreductase n=1 Tax=Actinomadura sp. CNU-125 TaxID=1904961 RepID=UPI000B098DC2|nr:FAD/NAD(P)-binding oxidoreductase [Actinomadura sp. CNU-125]